MHYYQHHIGDFIKDTANLNDHQLATYLRMIWAYYTDEKCFTDDCGGIAFAVRSDEETVRRLLAHYFVQTPDGWEHPRCEREIGLYREKAEKARNSANARWKNASAMRPHSERNANEPVLDANQEPRTKKKKDQEISAQQAEHVQSFERFWKFYPRKQGKQSALKSWLKIKPTDKLLNTIMAALANQRASSDWLKDGGKFIPHASTWINQSRWEDEVRYVPEDTRGSASHLSLVDQVRQRNGIPAQRSAPPAGYGAQGSLVAVDGEVVGHDDQHVWP